MFPTIFHDFFRTSSTSNCCNVNQVIKPNVENKRSNVFIHVLDELLSKNCELGCFEIFVIAEQCERDTKLNFSPRKVISHLGITLNVLELTSINSTDDKKTIENLVDMVIIYFLCI